MNREREPRDGQNETSAEYSSPRLLIARYRLHFASAEPLTRRGYLGSAWRGVLGRNLRRLVCVTQCEQCPSCMLYLSCVYPYVFETPPPPSSQKLVKYPAAPHPFVLAVPPESAEQRTHTLGLTLFGRGNHYLAYLIHALRTAGQRGLGNGSVPLELNAVEQETGAGSGRWLPILAADGTLSPLPPEQALWPEPPRRLKLLLITPLRLRSFNDYVTPEAFRFSMLFSNLLRRVSLLMYFHGERPLETDFAGLVRASREVPLLSSDLRWKEWTRYSSRQRTRMQMGGLIGSIGLDGAALGPLWPYLWLGQWTHAGKATSMGLGRYEITPE